MLRANMLLALCGLVAVAGMNAVAASMDPILARRVTETETLPSFFRITNSDPSFFGIAELSRPSCVAISAPSPPSRRLTGYMPSCPL